MKKGANSSKGDDRDEKHAPRTPHPNASSPGKIRSSGFRLSATGTLVSRRLNVESSMIPDRSAAEDAIPA